MDCKDCLRIIPVVGGLAAITYLVYKQITGDNGSGDHGSDAPPKVNQSVKKDCDKVVDCLDMEDLGDSAAFCRCWRSKKFPYCDGSHGKHNKETGDNVGPLCLSRKSASS